MALLSHWKLVAAWAAVVLLCAGITLGWLCFRPHADFARPGPMARRNPADEATLAYLADCVGEQEKRLSAFEVAFRMRDDVAIKSSQEDVEIHQTIGYVLAMRNGSIYFEERHPGTTVRYYWNGDLSKALYLRTRADGTPLDKKVVIADVKEWRPTAMQFMELSRLWLDGSQRVSAAIVERGVRARRQGNQWVVTLRPADFVRGVAEEVLVIRPDRDYRVSRYRKLSPAGASLAEARIVKWVGGVRGPWLPADIRWTFFGPMNGTKRLNVTSSHLSPSRVTRSFSLPDDGITPTFDRRANRTIRTGPEVPLTGERLESSYNALAQWLRTPAPRSARRGASHDNGARTQPQQCGIQCVWMLGRLAGRTPDYDRLARDNATSDGKHSMAQLQDAAKSMGVELQGLVVPVSQISRIATPCIVYVPEQQGGHFCVIAAVVEGQALIFDPPARTVTVPISLVQDFKWGPGYVLAPARASGGAAR